MNLKSVEINNFRSIKHEIIDFSFDTCKILVGINESGKSNVLKAISSLNKKYGPEHIRRSVSGEDVKDYNIIFTFSLAEEEKSSLIATISKNFFDYNNKKFFIDTDGNELSLTEMIKNLEIQVIETSKKQHEMLTNMDNFDFVKNTIYATNKETVTQSMLPDNYTLENKYFLEKDFIEEFYDCKTLEISIFKSNILTYIKGLVDKQIKKVLFWEFREESILPAEINYQTFLNNPNTNLTLKALFEIANKENWTTELMNKISADKAHVNSYLKNNFSKKILGYFKEKWPELNIKDFSITVDGDLLRFAFIDEEDNEYITDERSDGFKRFITFLILISGKNSIGEIKDNIILVDEPDLAIHIKGQIYLLKELLNIAENNIVVFSTHSPFMIDKSNIGRHYIVKKSNEITSLIISDDSNFTEEEVLFQALGYTIFCNIKNKNILFEGYWDNYVFNKLKDCKFDHIGHIYMGGVKNAQSVSKIIELQDKEYTIISDSDKPAKDSKKEFKKVCDGKWVEYGDIVQNIYTLEDFVDNYKIKNALNSLFKLKEFTSLQGMDLSFIDNLTNKKLNKITGECYKYNNAVDKKLFQTKLKEKIFTNIKTTDILDSYNILLEFILNL